MRYINRLILLYNFLFPFFFKYFKYHSVLCGKPRGGNYHWIDNHLVRATRYKGKFTDLIEKQVTIEVFKEEGE